MYQYTTWNAKYNFWFYQNTADISNNVLQQIKVL